MVRLRNRDVGTTLTCPLKRPSTPTPAVAQAAPGSNLVKPSEPNVEAHIGVAKTDGPARADPPVGNSAPVHVDPNAPEESEAEVHAKAAQSTATQAPGPSQNSQVDQNNMTEEEEVEGDDDAMSICSEPADFSQDLKTDLRAELDSIGEERAPAHELNARRILKKWVSQAKHDRSADHLLYILAKSYRDAPFPRSLEKRDQTLLNHLRSLQGKIPFEIFLVEVERYEEDAPGPGTLPLKPAVSGLAKKVAYPYGYVCLYDVELNASNLLQPEFLESSGPGRKKHQVLHGGDTGIMLVPGDSVPSFLLMNSLHNNQSNNQPIVDKLIHRVVDALECGGKVPRWRYQVFQDLCVTLWELEIATDEDVISDDANEAVLRAVLHRKDWAFFEKAAELVRGHVLPARFFGDWLGEEIRAQKFSLTDVKKGVDLLLVPRHIEHVCMAIRILWSVAPDEEGRAWAQELLKKSFRKTPQPPLGKDDGRALVALIREFCGFNFFETTVVPYLRKKASKTSFLISVLEELRAHVEPGWDFTSGHGQDVFLMLLDTTINALNIAQLFSIEGAESRCPAQGRKSNKAWGNGQPCRGEAVQKAQLIALSSMLLSQEPARYCLLNLALKITNDAALLPSEEFTPLWLPWLRDMIPLLERHRVPLDGPLWRHIFGAILEAFAMKTVGRRPRDKWSPAKRELPCNCEGCKGINAYLASGDVSRRTFKFCFFDHEEKRYNHYYNGEHLKQVLRDSHLYDCIHWIEPGPNYQTLQTVLHIEKKVRRDDAALSEWRRKRRETRPILQLFDVHKLVVILGRVDYERIGSMRILDEVDWALEEPGQGAADGSTPPPKKPMQSSLFEFGITSKPASSKVTGRQKSSTSRPTRAVVSSYPGNSLNAQAAPGASRPSGSQAYSRNCVAPTVVSSTQHVSGYVTPGGSRMPSHASIVPPQTAKTEPGHPPLPPSSSLQQGHGQIQPYSNPYSSHRELKSTPAAASHARAQAAHAMPATYSDLHPSQGLLPAYGGMINQPPTGSLPGPSTASSTPAAIAPYSNAYSRHRVLASTPRATTATPRAVSPVRSFRVPGSAPTRSAPPASSTKRSAPTSSGPASAKRPKTAPSAATPSPAVRRTNGPVGAMKKGPGPDVIDLTED